MRSRTPYSRFLVAAAISVLLAAAQGPPSEPPSGDPLPRVLITTAKGAVEIEVFPAQAPKTVANFLEYVDSRAYDDTIFHRVISGFVVQGGGFTPELEMIPTLPPVKIETTNKLQNVRGSVAMARSLDRDSATSQFYINLSDNTELNRGGRQFGYTVFGRVTAGMAVVDRISRVQTSQRGLMKDVPIFPVIVESVRRVKTPGP